MSEKFKAPRGTQDVLPEQQPVRRRTVETASRTLEAAGYLVRLGTFTYRDAPPDLAPDP